MTRDEAIQYGNVDFSSAKEDIGYTNKWYFYNCKYDITNNAVFKMPMTGDDGKWKAESKAPLFELQHVLDELLAFWGSIDDRIDSKEIRNIIKAGKRIERVDLYARLGAENEEIRREVHRMCPRVTESGIPYQKDKLEKVCQLAEQEKLDYYEIVSNVEEIF